MIGSRGPLHVYVLRRGTFTSLHARPTPQAQPWSYAVSARARSFASHPLAERKRPLPLSSLKRRVLSNRPARRRSNTKTPSSSTVQPTGNGTRAMLDHRNPVMVNERTIIGMSLSDLAGHASFVGVTLSFLNTDILSLRILSMAASGLGIVFQYYRPIPLWIPIRWNVLFLAINATMIGLLLQERHLANTMSDEMEQMYKDGLFEQRGFGRVEFRKLFAMGQKVHLQNGDVLAQDGKTNTTLYWLTDGSVSIDKGAKHIATVHPPGFIGEMAFLNCFLVDEDEDGGDSSIAGNIATANAVVGKGGAVAWTWTFEQLLTYLEHEREISNALSAYMNYDLRAKLVKKGVSMADLDSEETSPATKTTP